MPARLRSFITKLLVVFSAVSLIVICFDRSLPRFAKVFALDMAYIILVFIFVLNNYSYLKKAFLDSKKEFFRILRNRDFKEWNMILIQLLLVLFFTGIVYWKKLYVFCIQSIKIQHSFHRLLMSPFFRSILVVLAVLIFITRTIGRMEKAVKKIVRSLKGLFSKTEKKSENHSDYIDNIEEIRVGFSSAKAEEGKKRPTRIRRNLKTLARISDPTEKIRYAYGLIIEALIGRNMEIIKSDTTGQICGNKVVPGEAGERIIAFTPLYDRARYGGTPPAPEEAACAEHQCEEILGYLKSEEILGYLKSKEILGYLKSEDISESLKK